MAVLTFGGGVNEQDDINVQLDECVSGENFRLTKQQNSFRPRPAFDLKGTAPNAGAIRGIMQLVKRDNTQTNLVKAGDTVYDVNSSFVFTSKGTVNATSRLRGSTWALDDKLIITDLDKLTTVREWDGTTMTVMAHMISGVTDLYAKYCVADFNNRNWLFNVTTDSNDNPHVILVSEFENHDNMDNSKRAGDLSFSTGNEPFFLTIPDGRPINGAVEFFGSIVVSTEGGKLFRITGNDSTNYQISEYYSGSAAVGSESIVNIGNDLMYLRQGGVIEFFSATDTSGDVSADDASRWIQNTVNDLTDSIAVYNQKDQCVHFFVENKVLTFDKEIFSRGQFSPWMIDTTQHASNFNTEAVMYLRAPDDQKYTVYWGDDSGNLFDLNGVGNDGDAGTHTIASFRKTRLITELDNLRELLLGRLVYRRRGIANVQMFLDWSEYGVTTSAEIPLKDKESSAGTTYYGSNISPVYYSSGTGSVSYYNAAGVMEDLLSTVGFSPAGKGHSFFLTLSLNTTVPFLINRLETRNEASGPAQAAIS